jgi:PAS domain-containing protein
MQNELTRMVDALPGMVWTAVPDGQVDFLNQRWCEYTGLNFGDACGVGWQAAIHPEDPPELLHVDNSRWLLASPLRSRRESVGSTESIAGFYSVSVRSMHPAGWSNGVESAPSLRKLEASNGGFHRPRGRIIFVPSSMAFRRL